MHTTIKFDLRGLACVLSASNIKNDQLYHTIFLMPLKRLKIDFFVFRFSFFVFFFFFQKTSVCTTSYRPPFPPSPVTNGGGAGRGGTLLLQTSNGNGNGGGHPRPTAATAANYTKHYKLIILVLFIIFGNNIFVVIN